MLWIIQKVIDQNTNKVIFHGQEPFEMEQDNEDDLFDDLNSLEGRTLVGNICPDGCVDVIGWQFEYKKCLTMLAQDDIHFNELHEFTVYEECEHGDKDELIKIDGRNRIQTGLRTYHLRNVEHIA